MAVVLTVAVPLVNPSCQEYGLSPQLVRVPRVIANSKNSFFMIYFLKALLITSVTHRPTLSWKSMASCWVLNPMFWIDPHPLTSRNCWRLSLSAPRNISCPWLSYMACPIKSLISVGTGTNEQLITEIEPGTSHAGYQSVIIKEITHIRQPLRHVYRGRPFHAGALVL